MNYGHLGFWIHVKFFQKMVKRQKSTGSTVKYCCFENVSQIVHDGMKTFVNDLHRKRVFPINGWTFGFSAPKAVYLCVELLPRHYSP